MRLLINSPSSVILVVLLTACASYGLLIFYRLFLHPLRRTPGPKLAAASLWYEFYFDIVLNGRYQFKIQELHRQYGPILRIGPDHVHVNDPGFADVLFTSGFRHRRDKDPVQASQFGTSLSSFGSSSHDTHRTRRTPVHPLFSKAAVAKVLHMVRAKAQKLCQRIETDYAGQSRALPLSKAITCFTSDVITEYALRQTSNWLLLPDFGPNMHDLTSLGLRRGHLNQHLPHLMRLMASLPEWLLSYISPEEIRVAAYRRGMTQKIAALQKQGTVGADSYRKVEHPIIFEELMKSSLPDAEKQPARIGQECRSIVAAGVDTASWALSVGIFHVLSHPDMCARLVAEVDATASHDDTSAYMNALEQLPYLIIYNAVMHESLRLAVPSTRLMRIAPDVDLVYKPVYHTEHGDKQYIIPAGYSVGMSPMFLNKDEHFFPDGNAFKPERWLSPESGALQRHMFSFGKGSRQCVGINLAYAELRVAFFELFRNFGSRMHLFETSFEDDIECYHDHTAPFSKTDRGVTVKVGALEKSH